MQIKTVEQLSDFLKTRDQIEKRVQSICNKHGYTARIESWNVEGDKLVVHFVEGGQFHLATYFTRKFQLNELL